MSLSRWFRDYLYIPLGGNRGSPLADVPQPDDRVPPQRPVARRELDVRDVGRVPRHAAAHRAGRPASARGRGTGATSWQAVDDRPRAGRLGPVPVARHAATRSATCGIPATRPAGLTAGRRARRSTRWPLAALASAAQRAHPARWVTGVRLEVAPGLVGRVLRLAVVGGRCRPRSCSSSRAASARSCTSSSDVTRIRPPTRRSRARSRFPVSARAIRDRRERGSATCRRRRDPAVAASTASSWRVRRRAARAGDDHAHRPPAECDREPAARPAPRLSAGALLDASWPKGVDAFLADNVYFPAVLRFASAARSRGFPADPARPT